MSNANSITVSHALQPARRSPWSTRECVLRLISPLGHSAALSRLASRLLDNLQGDSASTLIGWPGVPPTDNGARMCRQH